MPSVTQPAGGQPARARRRPAGPARRPGRRRRRRAARRPAGWPARRRRRPRRRRARKSCPSTRSPATRDEQVAGRRRCASRGSPRRSRAAPAAAPVSSPPASSATSARVSAIMRARPGACEDLAQHVAVVEGVHRAGDLLAGLVALAGHEQGVARAGPARRRRPARRAGRPISSTSARRSAGHVVGTPASIAARMAAGSSERGLSSVTTSTSLPAAAAAPIAGRLPGSRSPPQPSTVISRPAGRPRAARPAPC